MPDQATNPASSVLMRLLSQWVSPEALPANPATLVDTDVPVVYVLESGGIADTTALAIMCEKHGLPHPRSSVEFNGLRLRRRNISLKRSQPFGIGKKRKSIPNNLIQLIAAANGATQHEDTSDCLIVPVSVYWGREPEREDSIWRQMFSETWEIAGRPRKLFMTMVHGRNTLVSFSEPFSLTQFMSTSVGATEEITQRKFSRILRVHFRQRRIATIGPDLSHRRMLINHVLADSSVRKAIDHEASISTATQQSLQAKAKGYAHEIAADVSYRTVRILQKVLSRLWTKLYDGVEFTGVDRLKAVADGREVVYVPCHRSHIDYLLLSYILYTNGYSLPHIAAGINLNMPIVGGILRRGGAFFLRRSFAGSSLYPATFNAYLKELIQRGHALEYFIEGGRSRTGRLLPPKGGMLAMTIQAYLHEPQRPVVFVPVYFGYERLLEGKAFSSELAGGKKRKESIFSLLKSLKTLREDYGRVYVNISAPIELNTLLDSNKPNWRSEPVSETRPAWIKPIVNELGETIMQRINEAASVTPVSLVATALLATPKNSLGKGELATLIKTYHGLISGTHQNTEVVVPNMSEVEMIEHTQSLGYLIQHSDKLGDVMSVKHEQVSSITYFKNNIQHLLALPSAIACAFSNRSKLSNERVHELISPAYPFLQAELFIANKPDEIAIQDALKVMESQGLLTAKDGLWKRAPGGSTEAITLMRLAQSTMPAIERYYLNTAVISAAGPNGLSLKQFSERCQAVAERLALTHDRDNMEWFDKHVLTRFVTTMESTGRLQRSKSDMLILNPEVLQNESDVRLLLNEQTRHAILAAAHRFGD